MVEVMTPVGHSTPKLEKGVLQATARSVTS